jgi:hypothetical protein
MKYTFEILLRDLGISSSIVQVVAYTTCGSETEDGDATS